jgi:predicted Zn-dependent protease
MRGLLRLSPVLLLAACASAPEPVPPQAPSASGTRGAVATPAVTAPVREPASNSAVDRLLAEARTLRAGGDLDASFARLDRALRIAPERATVYLELARNHRIAGSRERSAASAERGLLYCRGSECDALRALAER